MAYSDIRRKVVLLPYDFDTAIGIDNVGALVFGYSLEDIDQFAGADVFHGQQSVLWKNLREMYYSEIREMYASLRSGGNFSYDKIEQMFEKHQEKWPEVVFNEDAKFKYLIPLEEDGDGSYLSMLQGDKAEQRKWWLFHRFHYLDSKYITGTAVTEDITMRAYAPSEAIHITPHSDIYINVLWASTQISQKRATAGTSYTITCPLPNLNETEISIYSASQIASLGDLSALKLGYANISKATALQDLIIGSADPNYDNGRFSYLTTANNPMLRKIDVRNCSGLGTYDVQRSVNLSGCEAIEELYFEGTNIRGVVLPNGGVLKILHLPGTITELTIRNQSLLTDFSCPDFSNITRLWFENIGNIVDVRSIVQQVPDNCRFRWVGFDQRMRSISILNTYLEPFEKLTGLNQNGDVIVDENGQVVQKPQIIGKAYLDYLDADDADIFYEKWPDITLDADEMTVNVRFWSEDGSMLLQTNKVYKGMNIDDPPTPPAKPHTISTQYVFEGGWSIYKNSSIATSGVLRNVRKNVDVYAVYRAFPMEYTVTLYSQDSVVTTLSVAYGEYADLSNIYPTRLGLDSADWRFFKWSLDYENVPITGDTIVKAYWNYINGYYPIYMSRDISTYVNNTVTIVANGAFYYAKELMYAEFRNATAVQRSAFHECSKLDQVILPKVTNVGYSAFYGCSQLRSVSLPAAITIDSYAFYSNIGLISVELPNVTSVGTMAFYNCSSLEFNSVSLPKVTRIQGSAFKFDIGLKEIEVSNVSTVDDGAFMKCTSLQHIDLPNITAIQYQTFSGCSSLVEISADNITSIGSEAFFECTSLTSVQFNKLHSIATSAFEGCAALETVEIVNIQSIGERAFAGCSSLTTLFIDRVAEIPTCAADAFEDSAFDNGTGIIYVPDDLIVAFKHSASWQNYADLIHKISEYSG